VLCTFVCFFFPSHHLCVVLCVCSRCAWLLIVFVLYLENLLLLLYFLFMFDFSLIFGLKFFLLDYFLESQMDGLITVAFGNFGWIFVDRRSVSVLLESVSLKVYISRCFCSTFFCIYLYLFCKLSYVRFQISLMWLVDLLSVFREVVILLNAFSSFKVSS